jgi:Carboxypeptidase regulatory-like domain/TonB-dependent Receptor Plug Domain
MQASLRTRTLLLYPMLALPFVSPIAARAQTAATPGQIYGRVVDQSNGRPVAAVLLSLEGTALTAESSERGFFVFRDVPAGSWQLLAERIGYHSKTGTVELLPGAMLDVRISVATKPVELDSMLVVTRSGRLAEVGYYDRRDTGGLSGRFISAADIERRVAAQMTDMLVDVPAVKTIHQGPGRITVRFNRGFSAKGGCEPDLYIDGRLYRWSTPPITTDGTGTHFGTPTNRVDDFNAVPVNEIAGIEVYVGAAVPAFVTNTACGVILVWLKQ